MPASWPFFLAFFAVLAMLIVAAVADYLHDRKRRRCECGGLAHRLTVRDPLPTCTALPTAWRRGWRA